MIQAEYAQHFDCQLQHFMPHTLSLISAGQLLACTGFQGAASGRLFLEQYLDLPLEACMPLPPRQEIVEIGGFAVSHRQYALPFMLQLAPALADLGFTTVACTVTRAMRACLQKLGIAFTSLGAADPSRVDTSNNAWGNYYQHKPQILVGDININLAKMAPFLPCFALPTDQPAQRQDDAGQQEYSQPCL